MNKFSLPGEVDIKGKSQDFELNLAPIIDCFTVLITFMLVSASFLALGMFSAGLDAAGQAPDNNKIVPYRLEVRLLDHYKLDLQITGKEKYAKSYGAVNNSWDLVALESELANVRKRWPDLQSMTLSAQNDVEYEQVIRVMETARKQFSGVYLGGF